MLIVRFNSNIISQLWWLHTELCLKACLLNLFRTFYNCSVAQHNNNDGTAS